MVIEYNFKSISENDFISIQNKLNQIDDTTYEIICINNFLTNKECNILIKEAQYHKVSPSQIDSTIDTNYVTNHMRRSYTGYITDNNEISKKITNIVARLSGQPSENMEQLQIVRYEQGGFFVEHRDAGEVGQTSSRLYTFLIYLNNVEDGGETVFPKIDQIIKPIKGSCVIFKSKNNNVILDKSLHKANVVNVGFKCICTKWVHCCKLANNMRGDLT